MIEMETNIEGSKAMFVIPSFESDEMGEIERVKQYFGIKADNFIQKFVERTKQGKLEKLVDEVWDTVENTDSHSDNILRGDWSAVQHIAEQQEKKRDWQDIRNKMQNGRELDAPIIARRGDALHLVTGNTRLCVARAMGIRPDVIIVDISGIE